MQPSDQIAGAPRQSEEVELVPDMRSQLCADESTDVRRLQEENARLRLVIADLMRHVLNEADRTKS